MPPATKTTARKAPAKKAPPANQPADANLPITSDAPTTQPNVRTDAGTVARYAGDPTPADETAAGQSAKRSSKAPSVAVGDVVRLTPDEDTPDAAARYVQVVGKVPGTEHRDDGALVVPLPEPSWMPLSAFATD